MSLSADDCHSQPVCLARGGYVEHVGFRMLSRRAIEIIPPTEFLLNHYYPLLFHPSPSRRRITRDMLSSQPSNVTTHYLLSVASLIEIGGHSLGSNREKRDASRRKELFIQQGPGRVHLEPP
jgi:hypothetical protein